MLALPNACVWQTCHSLHQPVRAPAHITNWAYMLGRRFIVLALSLMLRLSYHSRVKELVPPSLATILPPVPQIAPLGDPHPPDPAPAQEQANGADGAAGEDGDQDTEMGGDAAGNGVPESREQRWAAEVVDMVGGLCWELSKPASLDFDSTLVDMDWPDVQLAV